MSKSTPNKLAKSMPRTKRRLLDDFDKNPAINQKWSKNDGSVQDGQNEKWTNTKRMRIQVRLLLI